jgi:hypothetical protein
MHRIRITVLLGCIALLGALTPASYGDTWDKKTTVTFRESVEVPGAVLEPGTYVMRLLDSPSNRHIVQFWNEDQNHLYSMAFAIPAERLDPPDRTIFTFYEMPSGQPDALKTWFYPGDRHGQEFTYPRERAVQISQVTGKQVPSEPVTPRLSERDVPQPRATADRDIVAQEQRDRELATRPAQPAERAPDADAAAVQQESQLNSSAVRPDEPARADREPELLAQNVPPPPPPAAADPAKQTPPAGDQTLPETASYTPLVGLAGLLSLGAAYGVRRIRRTFPR